MDNIRPFLAIGVLGSPLEEAHRPLPSIIIPTCIGNVLRKSFTLGKMVSLLTKEHQFFNIIVGNPSEFLSYRDKSSSVISLSFPFS